MMKKVLSVIGCLVPFGASAAVTPTDYADLYPNWNKPLNGVVGKDNDDYPLTGINVQVETDDAGVKQPGLKVLANAINIGADDSGASDGLTVAQDFIVGEAENKGAASGSVSVSVGTNAANGFVASQTGAFNIVSAGDVSVGGALAINDGFSLGIQSTANPIDVTLGAVTAKGVLTASRGIDSFTVNGALNSNVQNLSSSLLALDIVANTISLGALQVESGAVKLDATGALQVTAGNIQNTAAAGDTTITAASATVAGAVQNNAGNMVISLGKDESDGTFGGSLTTVGNLENTGVASRMEINAGDVIIGGTMKNDKPNANMVLNVNSLQVNGGNGEDASFVNAGNFYATVSGVTHFENGVKIDLMSPSNKFELNTGRLEFGNNVSANVLANMFNANLGDADSTDGYTLNITRGDLGAGGVQLVNGQSNANAKMNISAENIYFAGVQNFGTMNLNATADGRAVPAVADDSGNSSFLGAGLFVEGDIVGQTGSKTTITSQADIIAAAGVSNYGTSMVLNGVNVGLGAVYNDTGALSILASTSDNGRVYIDGGVTTAGGTVDISGRDIKIAGVITSEGGQTTIKSADSRNYNMQLELGGIDIKDGVVSLNSLASNMALINGLYVGGGALNIGYADNATNTQHLLYASGPITIKGDMTASGVAATGNGDVNIAANNGIFALISEDSTISIGGDVIATADDASRTIALASYLMDIDGNVTVANKGKVMFADMARNNYPEEESAAEPRIGYPSLPENGGTLDVAGALSVTDGGVADVYTTNALVGSLNVRDGGTVIARGSQIVADAGDIIVEGGVTFDGTDEISDGLAIKSDKYDTERENIVMNLQTTADGADITLRGGMDIAQERKLVVNSADAVTVAGALNNGGILDVDAVGIATFNNGNIMNGGTLDVNAASIVMGNVNNTSVLALKSGADIQAGMIENSGENATIAAVTGVNAQSIENTAGVLDISATGAGAAVQAQVLTLAGGVTDITADNLNVTGLAQISGNINQGGENKEVLNLAQGGMMFMAGSLDVSGALNAAANSVRYRAIDGSASVRGGVNVDSGAAVDVMALQNVTTGAIVNDGTLRMQAMGGKISTGDLTTTGDTTFNAANGIALGAVRANGGNLVLDVQNDNGNAFITAASLEMNGATATLGGNGLKLTGSLTAAGVLYQNSFSALAANDINVLAKKYEIETTNVNVAGISQNSGAMQIYTGDVTVGGDINATDLRFVTRPDMNYLDINIAGNVSGNVDFAGLEHMKIAGDYRFNDNSAVNAVVLKRGETPYNYWATVSLADDLTLGDITNGANANPLIEVGGQFITEITTNVTSKNWTYGNGSNGVALKDGQMGITLFDIVDQGSAIWLLHADKGIDELATKIRNLNVNFCNADGSLCFNYLDAYDVNNASGENLPVYISVRDSNADDLDDSLYIVFDPRFGGPVEVFKIQPIVAKVPGHTGSEYIAAGALDDMIIGQLRNKGFNNKTPIEAIPLAFKGTNLETVANELYDRMEYYVLERNEAQFVPFSRLFQVHELEQVMGALSLNEHTNFRSFEDRMLDEFIWNRNRNLKKAWLDVDYGIFVQDVKENNRIDGTRFNVSGGFDWQESETLVLGLTGRVSHTSSDNSDSMDLAYRPNTSVAGHVSTDVADTNIGLGGYLMKILGNKTRLYGNAFLDLHLFDVERHQTFVSDITGDGTSFALTTEWGLMHDLLNQYVVGNVYARLGYNFGMSITEKSAGSDYMKLESDGYAILTPGYSLTAQKRIYPSAWFQIRPYATVGIEYDVLGAPDTAQYKFAPAHRFTDYDIDIDPMWANIGGGFEFISATGIQVGVDYRYQYNNAIQLHNIKVSGSYRF